MNRSYQHDFSEENEAMFNREQRQRKARTMVKVFDEICQGDLSELSVLNVGGSAGIIDQYLAKYFGQVTGMDIDEQAIFYAQKKYQKGNLSFKIGDAMAMSFQSSSFDIVICSQVYEHVPDSNVMMKEIYRVLKPGGLVYFAAGNRLMFNEVHYNLPLLSVVPRPLAHIYLKLSGKGSFYYEKHLSYWGLKKLVKNFKILDFTKKIIISPEKYHADYLLKPNSMKHKLAKFITKYLYWLVPGYIWVLKKTD